MSLPHIILGLLQQQERTGYDLKTECFDCFDDGLAHLWPADQAQIYRSLEKLEAQGWVSCKIEIQADRPNRKVYRVTAAGQTELNRWLHTPQPAPIVREPLLVQLYFAADLSDAAILDLLQQELAVRRAKLAICEAIELPALNEPTASREQRLQRLGLELAICREQAYLNELQQAIEMIREQVL